MKVALLADISDPVSPGEAGDHAAFAWETAAALHRVSCEMGFFSVDLIARRGSWRGMPLITIDPEEIPLASPTRDGCRLRRDAIYLQFALSGMLRDYDLVHSLTPTLPLLQFLVSDGKKVLLTRVDASSDDTPFEILAAVLRRGRWNWTTPVACGQSEHYIPACVDTERFRPALSPRADFVAWTGSGGEPGPAAAHSVAEAFGLPLRSVADLPDPANELPHASVLMDCAADPSTLTWAVRALACGVPVAGWLGSGLETLVDRPEKGAVAAAGDVCGLIGRLEPLARSPEQWASCRRESVLLKHARRPVVAQYLARYRSLLGI